MNRITKNNNIKSNDNDIDNMGNKKNDIQKETTEERDVKGEDNFYNVSSSNHKSDVKKLKKLSAGKKERKNIYYGRRTINGNIGNNNNDFVKQIQNNDMYDTQQKMSAIGTLLGASHNDLSRTPSASYGQIMQQLAQQYPNHVNQSFLPGQMPPNQVSNMPVQQENMFQDNEALMKYLNASNIDPNTMNNYMAQQQMYQPMPQQMYQMPMQQQMIPQQPTMMTQQPVMPSLQSGGNGVAKKNPFFFQ